MAIEGVDIVKAAAFLGAGLSMGLGAIGPGVGEGVGVGGDVGVGVGVGVGGSGSMVHFTGALVITSRWTSIVSPVHVSAWRS